MRREILVSLHLLAFQSILFITVKSEKPADSIMASRANEPPSYTTNEEDQREAARIQSRLKQNKHIKTASSSSSSSSKLPSVEICDGAHKYVQITASLDGTEQVFVVSRRGAAYHRNAAEPFIYKLEQAGYYDINVAGGGRVFLDEDNKKISIFGFSYGFGKADHKVSVQVVKEDPRYGDYEVTWSDDGY